MQLTVTNEPYPIPRSDYEDEIAKYLDQIKSVQGMLSVMTMGSIKAPGLSDIDVICVVDDDFPSHQASRLSVKNLRGDLFLHGPVVIPVSLLEKLQYIIYASNLKTIWGEETHQRVDLPDIEVMQDLSLAYTIDFSESRFGQYTAAKESRQIDMRRWMTRLWSFVHTRDLCKSSGTALSSRSQEVIERIVSLRHDWLAGKVCESAEFIEIFLQSETVLQEVFLTACKIACKKIGSPLSYSTTKVFTSKNKRIACSPDCEYPTATTLKIPRVPLLRTTVAPANYASYLSQYLTPEGNAKSPRSNFIRTLHKRSRYVKALKKFHQEKSLSFSMGGYLGLPLPQEKTMKEAIFKLIWKAVPIKNDTHSFEAVSKR